MAEIRAGIQAELDDPTDLGLHPTPSTDDLSIRIITPCPSTS